MPFETFIFAEKGIVGADGRGEKDIYVSPSMAIPGGILVYLLRSRRVLQRYSFTPRIKLTSVTDLDLNFSIGEVYGDITNAIVPADHSDVDFATRHQDLAEPDGDNDHNDDETMVNKQKVETSDITKDGERDDNARPDVYDLPQIHLGEVAEHHIHQRRGTFFSVRD